MNEKVDKYSTYFDRLFSKESVLTTKPNIDSINNDVAEVTGKIKVNREKSNDNS